MTTSNEGADVSGRAESDESGSHERIYLSPPHMSGREMPLVEEVFESNWIAPLGPQVDAFEEEFAAGVGAGHALALNSGTAALHLALRVVGVERGQEVLVSTLTFAASAFPVLYEGAVPVFVDSERESWNIDPELLARALAERAEAGRRPAAVILVHVYGQSADLEPIVDLCDRYEVPLIEDAAEALGATYRGRSVGSFGRIGIFSFNGNKMITTSGGGMLVSDDGDLVERARLLSTQARDPAPHYEHSRVGFNYRMSNLLAAVGRGQLSVLGDRVDARRRIFARYASGLEDLERIRFMPEATWGRHARWLTTLTLHPDDSGIGPEEVRIALESERIEARPLWKPMHLQPVFEDCPTEGGGVAESLFREGLCLPSGSALSDAQIDRVVRIVRAVIEGESIP